MKAVFVRHGRDDERYRGGWSNLDLTPEGMEEARRLAGYLKKRMADYKVSRIVASDLPRTMTTARVIGEELGLEISKEPRIREINNGDLAGMLNEEALARYPGLFFNTLRMDEAYPNGESPQDFYRRIKQWFEEFCSNCHGEKTTLIVTHGGVINIIYHLVKHVPWSNKRPSYKAAYCSLHVLDMETLTFEAENQTAYE